MWLPLPCSKRLNALLWVYEQSAPCWQQLNHLGKTLWQLNELEVATRWYQQALTLHPANPEALATLAQYSLHQKQFAQALHWAQQWQVLAPEESAVYALISACYEALGDWKTAEACSQQALAYVTDSKTKAMVFLQQAKLAQLMGNSSQAIESLKGALLLEPRRLDWLSQLAQLYYEAGDFLKAREMGTQAIAISPLNAVLQANLGYLAWQFEDVAQARVWLEASVELDAGYDVSQHNLAVLMLDEFNDPVRAMVLLEEAIYLNPHYVQAHYTLGRAYAAMGNVVVAAQYLHQAQQINLLTQEMPPEAIAQQLAALFA
jgi:tetratricopeptide (TPR) repeat protein